MIQATLPFEAERRARVADSNAAHIDRVRDSIARHVHAFLCFAQTRPGRRFTSRELERYVSDARPCAPGSPTRIMRDAAQHGWCGVKELNRSSQYQLVYVRPFVEWVAPVESELERVERQIARTEARLEALYARREALL